MIALLASGDLVASTTTTFHHVLEWVVLGISAVTVGVLAWGVAYGSVRFIVIEAMRVRGESCDRARAMLRKQVGFYLLFALELLIAADVIETMISPTLEHLATLGGITLLRILTGFALERELQELEEHQSGA